MAEVTQANDMMNDQNGESALKVMIRICHSINLFNKQFDELFVSFTDAVCPVCSASVDGEFTKVHMHFLAPGDKHCAHGSGKFIAEAKEYACADAIRQLVEFDGHFLELKKARLRVRLVDFGCTVPTTGLMQMLQGGDEDGSLAEFPSQFRNLVEAVRGQESSEYIHLSEKLLSALHSWPLKDAENVFCKIGLSLCDEIRAAMNPYFLGFSVSLFLRIDVNALDTDEKLKLSFCKIMEQVVMFNADQLVGGEQIVGRLLRYFIQQRAVPFMAKYRVEVMAVQLSDGGYESVRTRLASLNISDQPLVKIIEKKTPPKEYLDSLFSEFHKINSVIREIFNVDGCIYGSLVNGFPTNSSDIDVVINLPDYDVAPPVSATEPTEGNGEEEEEGATATKYLEELNRLHNGIKSKFGDEFTLSKIESARVPILIVKKGEIEVNLSFNHLVVIHNSALLHAYNSISPKVRELVVLVKHWAKQRELNDSLQGTLSSYSYVLLVISYLQRRGFLPDLQNPTDVLHGRETPVRLTDGNRCSTWFLEDGFEGLRYSDIFSEYTNRLNKQSLTGLLVGFFEYYLYQFNYITDVVTLTSRVAVRHDFNQPVHPDLYHMVVLGADEKLKKRSYFVKKDAETGLFSLDFRGLRRRTWLSIADPFEIGRCLGTSARGAEMIVKEMRRAVDMIAHGESEYVFDQFKKKERIQIPGIPVRFLNKNDFFDSYHGRHLNRDFSNSINENMAGIKYIVDVLHRHVTKNISPYSSEDLMHEFRVACYLCNLGMPRDCELVQLGFNKSKTPLYNLDHVLKVVERRSPMVASGGRPIENVRMGMGPTFGTAPPPPPPPVKKTAPPAPPNVQAPKIHEKSQKDPMLEQIKNIRRIFVEHHPDHAVRAMLKVPKTEGAHKPHKPARKGLNESVGQKPKPQRKPRNEKPKGPSPNPSLTGRQIGTADNNQ